jgi:translation initiation factor 1
MKNAANKGIYNGLDHSQANSQAKALSSGLTGLADLAQLGGLVVKATVPVTSADMAAAAVASAQALRAKDVVRVSRETKGRGGKAVTLVKGISLPLAGLETLGKQLKAACGSGGTVKEGVIEVQGDHCDKVLALLIIQGYKAKRAGS